MGGQVPRRADRRDRDRLSVRVGRARFDRGARGSPHATSPRLRRPSSARPMPPSSPRSPSGPRPPLPVAVWLSADVSGVEAAVQAAHPEVQWLAGRPLAGTVEQARALRAELWEARRAVYAAAADTLAAEVEALGGRIGYASTSAPLVFVDVPAPARREPRRPLRCAQPWAGGDIARDDDFGRRDGCRQLDHRQR